jgi:hypothetical protein
MCLRFVFLLITRAASWLRLSRRKEAWKTAEILILRHQLAVLQRRQPGRPIDDLGGPGPAQCGTQRAAPGLAATGHPGHDPALAPRHHPPLGRQVHARQDRPASDPPEHQGPSPPVLADAGIRAVLCNVQTSRMNAIAERWIGGCRRELLDRTLIWNQDHLRQISREYENHHNQHRPSPLAPCRGTAETATRTGRSCSVPGPEAGSRRWHDRRIPPGRVTWMKFSAPTRSRGQCRWGKGPRRRTAAGPAWP